jgi:hypothetical protein
VRYSTIAPAGRGRRAAERRARRGDGKRPAGCRPVAPLALAAGAGHAAQRAEPGSGAVSANCSIEGALPTSGISKPTVAPFAKTTSATALGWAPLSNQIVRASKVVEPSARSRSTSKTRDSPGVKCAKLHTSVCTEPVPFTRSPATSVAPVSASVATFAARPGGLEPRSATKS